jgi:hypothetical protein
VEEHREEDECGHLEELALPVLEHRLEEGSRVEVGDERSLREAVLPSLLAIHAVAGERLSAQGREEDPQQDQRE